MQGKRDRQHSYALWVRITASYKCDDKAGVTEGLEIEGGCKYVRGNVRGRAVIEMLQNKKKTYFNKKNCMKFYFASLFSTFSCVQCVSV